MHSYVLGCSYVFTCNYAYSSGVSAHAVCFRASVLPNSACVSTSHTYAHRPRFWTKSCHLSCVEFGLLFRLCERWFGPRCHMAQTPRLSCRDPICVRLRRAHRVAEVPPGVKQRLPRRPYSAMSGPIENWAVWKT